MPRSLESTPKLREIISFEISPDRKIKILEQIGAKYNDFGVLLLDDDNGGVVTYIAKENHYKAVDINNDSVKRWLEGDGKQPVTWATLIGVLNDVGLKVLAKTIRDNLTTTGEV